MDGQGSPLQRAGADDRSALDLMLNGCSGRCFTKHFSVACKVQECGQQHRFRRLTTPRVVDNGTWSSQRNGHVVDFMYSHESTCGSPWCLPCVHSCSTAL
jgi:hypothetical protein